MVGMPGILLTCNKSDSLSGGFEIKQRIDSQYASEKNEYSTFLDPRKITKGKYF